MCEICSLQRCQRRRSSVFIVNFEQISHIVLAFSLLTLNNWDGWEHFENLQRKVKILK